MGCLGVEFGWWVMVLCDIWNGMDHLTDLEWMGCIFSAGGGYPSSSHYYLSLAYPTIRLTKR